MPSSKPNRIFDPLRKCFVVATPEEIIRQKLILHLMGELGFPKELIAVEKKIAELPHLEEARGIPDRRLDLLCFQKETFKPLLLIECKEGEVSVEAERQALGYNYFVKAPFVAVVGKTRWGLIHPNKENAIPHYQEMMRRVATLV